MPSMEWDVSNRVWAKICSLCKRTYTCNADKWADAEEAFTEYFYKGHGRTRDGLDSKCKGCKNAKRVNFINVPEQIKAQDHKCFLCDKKFTSSKTTHVDHDHTNGKTRKILCAYCNHLMGGIDNDEWLAKAIKYRDSYR